MTYELIEKIDHPKIGEFIAYLKNSKIASDKAIASGKTDKTPWTKFITQEQAIEFWNKVTGIGLYIDGETIIFQSYGTDISLSFNYQAYKNVVLWKYPESKFDFQLVHKGDSFAFEKESGKIAYKHVIADPFTTGKEVIGAYGIIKNSAGEFLEILNMDDINAMRGKAKSDYIWKEWFGEMVKKSVIRRVCKIHFKDIVKEIDAMDNENFDMTKIEIPSIETGIFESILKVKTKPELIAYHKKNSPLVKDQNAFVSAISARREQLYIKPETSEWSAALKMLQDGKLMPEIEKLYFISSENKELLISEAL